MRGIGFLGALTIVFVVLKLTEVIDWSWWLVFLPVLIGAGFSLIFVIFLFSLFILSPFTD